MKLKACCVIAYQNYQMRVTHCVSSINERQMNIFVGCNGTAMVGERYSVKTYSSLWVIYTRGLVLNQKNLQSVIEA